MIPAANQGRSLLTEIEESDCSSPTLWWLGHSGFVLKYHHAIIYVDPLLSDCRVERLMELPFRGGEVRHAGLILCTHAHPRHLDPHTVPAMLSSSRKAKLVFPKASQSISLAGDRV
jgi:L-ascorbate metabolism protein UlaG (beta-lactamase superfamily)